MGRRTLSLIASLLLTVAGTGLIALYVKGANDRAQAKAKLVEVLVLQQDVAAGESLKQAENDGAFTTVHTTVEAARGGAYPLTQLGAVEHLYAATKLYRGDVIRPAMLTGTAATTGATVTGIKSLGFTVDVQLADRAAGLLGAGDQARLYAGPKQAHAYALIKTVRVISVGPQRVVTTTSQDQVATTTVGLDATDAQARAIIDAKDQGDNLFLAVIGNPPPTPASTP
jgi:pilus assembly protein CpaB